MLSSDEYYVRCVQLPVKMYMKIIIHVSINQKSDHITIGEKKIPSIYTCIDK